jgi:hypothetical protein
VFVTDGETNLKCSHFLIKEPESQSISLFFAGLHPEEAICGSDVRRISGGPEDGREAVPRPSSGQPSLAPLPQGE